MSASVNTRRLAPGKKVSAVRASRVVLAAVLFLLLPAAAEAYTLVLRSGRHVNVPDNFRVTASAVVYETSPGFSVTVWLSSVDIAATERVNGEAAGSFAARAGRRQPTAQTASARRHDARSVVVTNKELEPLRQRREAQEEEYERTRQERGMPSVQELQERIEEHDRRLRELTRQTEADLLEAELEAMRSELANVRRQLGELNLQFSQQPGNYWPAYAPPSYYPYFYGPAVQVFKDFSFGHRWRTGRGNFGFHPHTGRWPHGRLPNHAPIYVSPSRHAGGRPPAVNAPRR